MNETFDDKVIAKIKTAHLKPISRWYFTTRTWALTVLIIIATFLSSVGVTLILFLLTDHDWFAVSYLDEGLPLHILKTIPYLWLIIIFIVVAIIYSSIKQVGRGYRYPQRKIIGVSLLASVLIGTALFISGAGTYLDTYLERTVPFYDNLIVTNKDIWVYPEQGLLSGTITAIDGDTFSITDSDEQPWVVTMDSDTQENTPLRIEKSVKIVGTMTDGSHFNASLILPWQK
ncbi:MAG: hypothetical protein JWM92_265 [Candidatus Nomurabacteria bacterium]|nr:hypothetical protein [Candidatus Nomurabacteria bacterium]